jgi:hypothetical protein
LNSQLLFLFLLFLLPSGHHPFYVSVAEFRYIQDKRELQVSLKIFWDDLEVALAEELGAKVNFMERDSQPPIDSLLGVYLTKNLGLEWDGKVVPLHYLGHEVEEDVVWCYLEASDLNSPQRVRLRNSLLVQSFASQQNIVNFYRTKTSSSLLLSRKKPVGELKW